MMTFKKERNISARAVTCAQYQWQKHHTNLKHLHQQSIAHKINILKYLEKNIKKSQCFSSNLRTKSMLKYTSHKKLRNLLRQLLSCKISHKIQLKNLKYLPPQTLACEVYRKQENLIGHLTGHLIRFTIFCPFSLFLDSHKVCKLSLIYGDK